MKKLKKEDFYVGQEVVLLHMTIGRLETPSISTGKVTSIGRKYINVDENYRTIRFDMTNDFKESSSYLPSYYLFLTVEDAQEKIYMREFYIRICNYNKWNMLNYDEAKAVERIVFERRGTLYCAMAVTESYCWVAHDVTEEDAKAALVNKYNNFFELLGKDKMSVKDFEKEHTIEVFPIISGSGSQIEI